MGFVPAIQTCLSKYVTWQGRASRSEYWWFYLAIFIALIVASIIDSALGITYTTVMPDGSITTYGYLSSIVGLGLFLPHLSVFVRRLHDRDKSGWWFWLVLIPLVGWIIIFIQLVSKGTTGANSYGADPLGGA